MHPLIGRLIVNFVLCLICFISYSSQIFVIWPWYGSVVSVELLALLVPFNTLVGMLLWNYFLCVVTDPGRVPDDWKPDTHLDGYEVKKLTGGPRHCRMCQKYKPPRAHHCRQCNRCVLRMDHHCPWVNNCVGHHNYGHFIRFLFYVDLACSYHLVMLTRRVFSAAGSRYWDEPSSAELVFIILNYVACVPVLLAVGGFSIYHFYSLLGNSTTIEGWEKDKAATMVRRGKIHEVKFPYNLGRRRNIESILGPNPLLWCWPTATPGTGLKYQLANDDDNHESWPPRDPAERRTSSPEQEFVLPSSPWTYENGSVNPTLEPFNAHLRDRDSSTKRRKSNSGRSMLPPYHPDYQEVSDVADDYSSEDSYNGKRNFVRRGSEGYEVRPVEREDMLQHYLRELGEEPGRYHRYIPYPESESEDDNIPLAQARGHISQ
ncbi:DHHC palmitoyltransferase-domain-containing protein [Collybia nuda]|uniref:Palmitoyltransferase PFA4 n=1 Tax=Collybia nuda TaxID=64659 RepID=A0A9P5YL50_9AGAR|nr:DHHC palmitoyltransferase-domain-containing protein [Collybia nuda]